MMFNAFFTVVQPICLPSPSQDYNNVAALVTGWGRLSSSGPLAEILQEATVRTLSTEQCRAKYGQNKISDNMISSGLDKEENSSARLYNYCDSSNIKYFL